LAQWLVPGVLEPAVEPVVPVIEGVPDAPAIGEPLGEALIPDPEAVPDEAEDPVVLCAIAHEPKAAMKTRPRAADEKRMTCPPFALQPGQAGMVRVASHPGMHEHVMCDNETLAAALLLTVAAKSSFTRTG
jgi:hypothetical protein